MTTQELERVDVVEGQLSLPGMPEPSSRGGR